MKDEFMEGLRKSKTGTKVANDLWSLMTAAADYSFNRSHAACYGLITYRTAYLRANYPAEYMAALISTVMSTKDKVPYFVNRCEEMGIEVLPPDVNTSDHGFVVAENNIRFGLDAVKNVGHAAVEAILRARAEDGEFASLWDFCERVDARAVNKRAVECLIKCGALDSTGASRRGMVESLPAAQSAGHKAQEDAQLGQGSIFDIGDGAAAGRPAAAQRPSLSAQEYEKRELLAFEKETLGTYLSSHPLADVREALRARVDCGLAGLATRPDGSWVTVGGMVTERKQIRTKKGDPMMFATLDDVEGQVEMIVFHSAFASNAETIAADAVLIVKGRVDHKERGETKLIVQEAEVFEPAPEEIRKAASAASRPTEPLVLRVSAADFPPTLLEELKLVFDHFPGDTEVLLEMQTREGPRRLRFGSEYRVRDSTALRAELDGVLGPGVMAA
jgi:DNA polymerase-3 subunit alpha